MISIQPCRLQVLPQCNASIGVCMSTHWPPKTKNTWKETLQKKFFIHHATAFSNALAVTHLHPSWKGLCSFSVHRRISQPSFPPCSHWCWQKYFHWPTNNLKNIRKTKNLQKKISLFFHLAIVLSSSTATASVFILERTALGFGLYQCLHNQFFHHALSSVLKKSVFTDQLNNPKNIRKSGNFQKQKHKLLSRDLQLHTTSFPDPLVSRSLWLVPNSHMVFSAIPNLLSSGIKFMLPLLHFFLYDLRTTAHLLGQTKSWVPVSKSSYRYFTSHPGFALYWQIISATANLSATTDRLNSGIIFCTIPNLLCHTK